MSGRLTVLCHSRATTCCAVLACASSTCEMGGLGCIFSLINTAFLFLGDCST